MPAADSAFILALLLLLLPTWSLEHGELRGASASNDNRPQVLQRPIVDVHRRAQSFQRNGSATELFGWKTIPAPRQSHLVDLAAPAESVTEKQWQLAEGVFLRYANWHRANRGKSDAKYMVWVCSGNADMCGGFSDRTKGMAGLLLHAMLSKRVYLSLYDAPEGISTLTPPNAIDWKFDGTGVNPGSLRVGQAIDNHAWSRSDFSSMMGQTQAVAWRCNTAPKLSTGLSWWSQVLDSSFVANAPARFRDSPSIFHSREEVEAVYSLPLGMLQAMTYRYLFKQHDTAVASIVSGLRQRIQDWGKPFIGLHVRNGDGSMRGQGTGKPQLPDLSGLLETAKKCGGLSMFIGSDDPYMVAAIQAALPPTVLALSCCSRAGHIAKIPASDRQVRKYDGFGRISYTAHNAMQEVFITYELWSRADVIVSIGTKFVGSFVRAAAFWELERQVPMFRSFGDAQAVMQNLC